jgi:hypothetical protein
VNYVLFKARRPTYHQRPCQESTCSLQKNLNFGWPFNTESIDELCQVLGPRTWNSDLGTQKLVCFTRISVVGTWLLVGQHKPRTRIQCSARQPQRHQRPWKVLMNCVKSWVLKTRNSALESWYASLEFRWSELGFS